MTLHVLGNNIFRQPRVCNRWNTVSQLHGYSISPVTVSVAYSPFQKNWSLTTTTRRWYEGRLLQDPDMVFEHLSKKKKKKTMFGGKNKRPVWVLGLFPAAAVWTSLCAAAQSTFFFILSISRLCGCYFLGWGSPVGSFLISETSTFTIDNGDEARKGCTTEPWHSPPYRQRRRATVNVHPKKHVWFDKKKSPAIFLYNSTSRIFLLSYALHRTRAVAEQSHR